MVVAASSESCESLMVPETPMLPSLCKTQTQVAMVDILFSVWKNLSVLFQRAVGAGCHQQDRRQDQKLLFDLFDFENGKYPYSGTGGLAFKHRYGGGI
jgi:hypothetical protein